MRPTYVKLVFIFPFAFSAEAERIDKGNNREDEAGVIDEDGSGGAEGIDEDGSDVSYIDEGMLRRKRSIVHAHKIAISL